MAVLTPRLVLVCVLPAVVTLLTVLWTRRKRKSFDTGTNEPPLSTSDFVDHSVHNIQNQTSEKERQSNHNTFEINSLRSEREILPVSISCEKQDVKLVSEPKENFRAALTSQSANFLLLSSSCHCPAEETTQESQSFSEEETVNLSELPKMHVKTEDSRLVNKLDQEGHLSPEGGSTSDLSERQNSPVNSDASYSEVIEESKPRRNRSNCRLSEESRDSAMGVEEDVSNGEVYSLLEASPSTSLAKERTDLEQHLPELPPPVNGESGCYNDLDEVLESPPPSIYSDGHSEGSCDSGKGGSDIQAVSNGDLTQVSESSLLVYEFELSPDLCGRLIGRLGRNVNLIKSSSNASVYIKRHPFNSRLKLCAVQGTKSEIRNALDMIRKRFPLSLYPALTLAQVNIPLSCGVMVPETLQLHLPDGVTCDVILSSMVSAGHFFVQQPTHPTYPSLNRLDSCMTSCYSQMDTPQLPQPIEVGVICACPVLEGWYRAQVVNLYENSEECDVKFVDYGGYSCVPMTRLRQIRSDFMTLPFQASECYLANVKPTTVEGWSLEACATFEELAQGQILQSLVVGHADDGIPYVHLYRVQGVSTVFINRELVNRGVGQWMEAEM